MFCLLSSAKSRQQIPLSHLTIFGAVYLIHFEICSAYFNFCCLSTSVIYNTLVFTLSSISIPSSRLLLLLLLLLLLALFIDVHVCFLYINWRNADVNMTDFLGMKCCMYTNIFDFFLLFFPGAPCQIICVLIDLNGMSTRPWLFYVNRLENRAHGTFIFTFLCCRLFICLFFFAICPIEYE